MKSTMKGGSDLIIFDNIPVLAQVKAALDDPDRTVLVQTSAAVRMAIGKEFGLKPGTDVKGKLYTALRILGFDGVYDTEHNADLTILEESTEFIHRLFKTAGKPGFRDAGPLPQFASYCPTWTKYVNNNCIDLLPYLSKAKSPQQIIKTYAPGNLGLNPQDVFLVSLIPDAGPNYDCQGIKLITSSFPEVDAFLTTNDLAEMIKEKRIDLNELIDGQSDKLFGAPTGTINNFNISTGVTTAVLRTTYELLNSQPLHKIEFQAVPGLSDIWESKIDLPIKLLDQTIPINVCMISGISNTKKIVNDVLDGKSKYHFIEVLNCPGGCIYCETRSIRQTA